MRNHRNLIDVLGLTAVVTRRDRDVVGVDPFFPHPVGAH